MTDLKLTETNDVTTRKDANEVVAHICEVGCKIAKVAATIFEVIGHTLKNNK